MATKEVAIKKRAQIDQATQIMLVAVCLASMALGCAAVLSVHFVKWMGFNAKVMGEQDAVIKDFKEIQKNMEVLAMNVDALSENEDLEVMARTRENRCMGPDGRLINLRGEIGLSRTCSALRVIPDTLPSVQNEEAVYASLNRLFLETKNEDGSPVEPEAISPGSGSNSGSSSQLPEGLSVVPVTLLIRDTATTAKAVLSTIESSIRGYDVVSAMITWRGGSDGGAVAEQIELRGNAAAYYSVPTEAILKQRTIYADDSRTAGGGTRK